METLIPLTFASLVLAVATVNVSGEALLSPRAKDNQIKIVSSVDKSSNLMTQNHVASPRSLDNQSKAVKGTDASAGTVVGACAFGSPKQLDQAGKTGAACCSVTATCTTPKSCCEAAGKL